MPTSMTLRQLQSHLSEGRPELTGRRRYRESEEHVPDPSCNEYYTPSCLVLQVEVSVWASGREDKLGRWVCQWRDATPEDVQKGELV